MSSQKTEHYQLHKWEPGDDFLREEFNENFTKLDASARMTVGAYTGDCASSRVIDLGFAPRAVFVITDGGMLGSAPGTYHVEGGLALPGHPLKLQGSATQVMELTGAGFTIHHWEAYISVNTQGAVFYYWALQ